MGFAIMSMTDGAAARVKSIVENSGPDAKGIRVGINAGEPIAEERAGVGDAKHRSRLTNK